MNDNTVEIRLRTEYENDSKHLSRWPLDRLDELPRLIERWGLSVTSDPDFGDLDAVVGQFRLDDSGAYFELIASTPEIVP